MAWRVWAEPILPAHLATPPRFFQPFTLERSSVIAVIRTWLVIFNDPTFTSAELRIYADHAGSPSILLHSSETRTKEEICTLDHGCRDVPFIFSPKPALKVGVTYHLVLWLNGYSGDESSFVAWRKDFPSPSYESDVDVETVKLSTLPFSMAVIGSRF